MTIKPFLVTTLALGLSISAGAALAQKTGGGGTQAPTTPAADPSGINFGDDASQWSNDGECDDRRFAGNGMAAALGWGDTGHDASDCRNLVQAGAIRLWNFSDALAATQCSAINFGDDSGSYPNDGECDDMRFEGMGMASFVGPDEVGKDATDCQRTCEFGMVGLRDY